MTMTKNQRAIREAVATFPDTFRLRAFPGQSFHLSTQDSYVSSAGGVRLAVRTETGQSFWTGPVDELRAEIVQDDRKGVN